MANRRNFNGIEGMGSTDLRDRPSANYFMKDGQAQNSDRNMLEYKTGQMIKMEGEIQNLHAAMAKLESEKEDLENAIRLTHVPSTQGAYNQHNFKLEQENRELKKMLAQALEEKDILQRERVSSHLQKRPTPAIFDTPQNLNKANHQFMDDDSVICNSVEGSLYFN